MKAVYIEAHGGPEVLQFGDRPEPSTKPNEVKIKIQAAGINRLDLYTREGGRGLKRDFPPPLILGGDSAGDIVEIGSDVKGISVGDRVVVNPLIDVNLLGGTSPSKPESPQFMGSAINGSYAEYVSVPAVNVHILSDNVAYDEAAAVPTTFLPIWNMVVRRARLKPWETVLILSASAGVGTAAIQIAKNVIGANVIATTSTSEKAELAKQLGADHVINYNEEDIVKSVKNLTDGKGVDVLVDHVGADFFNAGFSSLKPGGRYTICGATTGLRTELHLGLLFSRQIEIYGGFMGSNDDMKEIVAMLNKGVIHPVIHKTFPLESASIAHQTMEATNFFGKLVLKP
ncbi:MAG: zinc-binding dehydrogenase [Chloroflexota bacterium]|nr:zinc-binding dehydrogenase [Chloroflexota bacterium]